MCSYDKGVMMLRKSIPAMVAVVLVVSIVACSGGGDDNKSSARTTTTAKDEVTTTTIAEGSESVTTTTTSNSTTTTAEGQTTTPVQTVCPETQNWNTSDDSNSINVMSTDPIYLFTAARHGCYDQLMFVLNGKSPVGFHASYSEDGTVLAINIRAPNQGGPYDNTGHQPGHVFAEPGKVLYPASNPMGLSVIQEVIADGEFESVAMFNVKVGQRRPFAVIQDFNSSDYRVVIVRVAH
jgi:hypothetical protein